MTGPVVYTEHSDHTVHATAPGNTHELVWHPTDGNVTLDDQSRPMGLHLPEPAFHTQAETFFGVKHQTPAELVAWLERDAAQPVPCGCSPSLLCPVHFAEVRAALVAEVPA